MIINILLIIMVLGSAFAFWYRLSVKIPELVAVPDQVIAERLEEDSAKFRLFLLHFKTWFLEKRYKIFLLNAAGKAIYRLHILFLKLDNALVALLKKIRESGVSLDGNGQNGRSDYWKRLQNAEASPSPHASRIQEVRQRDSAGVTKR